MTETQLTRLQWSSLVDLLRCRATALPDSPLFAFLPDGEDRVPATFTRGELDLRARVLAVQLRDLGLDGGRALLLYPPGLEFIVAFFGCLYAGVVAVPAYLPRLNRPMERLRSIVVDASPFAILTSSCQAKDSARWESGVPELRGLHRVVTDLDASDPAEFAGRWQDPGAGPDTLAFLQYTSGSTAAPKGVMITHGNLLDNSSRIQTCFESSPESRGVFWLPLFHDMGLIGGVVQTVHCGGSSTFLSPVSFLQRPLRWLQAISRTGATISGAPNFAYDLCVEKTTPEQRAGLDLSHWRVAFNGAEPVRAETLDRFASAFASVGFRRESFLPCYGLAEATLLVSGSQSGNPPVTLSLDTGALERGEVAETERPGQTRRLAASGRVAAGHRAVIVDPTTLKLCAHNRVGEICVSGPSVAVGYWGRAQESEQQLRATFANVAGSFLRTGDLGFLNNGDLFVTGRLKDMIILRGRNVYPHDIEWTAERCHSAARAAGAAALGVEIHGEEQLAVVQECERNCDQNVAEEVIAAIRRAVALEHDIDIFAIRLIKPLSLPRTSSGKVRRHVCREAFLAGSLEVIAEWTRQDAPTLGVKSAINPANQRSEVKCGPARRARDEIAMWLAAKVAGPLGIRPDEVDTRNQLAGFGIGSLQAVGLASELEEWLGSKLSPTLVYDYPTIDALAEHLAGENEPCGERLRPGNAWRQAREPIAIVGIGCRFPGAAHPDAFWKMLCDGAEGIGPIPGSRWNAADMSGRGIPERGGFLQGIDGFDADFFGISPREAVYIDPQHRLLLELAWEALEDGGQVPEQWAGAAVGVFIGIATNDYAQLQAARGGASDPYRITGCAASIAANRISHHFDFRGPSLAIDTACSSSLVAVDLACRSLWDGESEMAMAGGVNLILAPEVLANFARAGFLAPDGRCKTFDARANGYVRGEGAGIVVLKPLSRALADDDSIYAVIRGGAINQDGRTNGLTAPSRSAQEAVLRLAYKQAGISPGQVDYIEAHGTGTLLGDPIELGALGAVLSEGREPGRKCALGSVKTNIGHLEAAAGIAGLIKTALALHHQAIPPSLNFSEPNPHVAFHALPLQVQCDLGKWPESIRNPIAGVSSFGFGGTNAHLVMEKAPPSVRAPRERQNNREREEFVVPLSAKSPAALLVLARSFRDYLASDDVAADARDLAHTAGARRGHHDHRLALVVSSRDEIIEALDSYLRGEAHLCSVSGKRLSGRDRRLVFVFSDLGGIWHGAGRAHLQREPVFRAAVEQCDAIMSPRLGWSPMAELMVAKSSSRIDDPNVDRLIQFVLQVGLTALWKSWGIVPTAIVGDGIGEIAAAYAGGSLNLEDAARIAIELDLKVPRFPAAIAELVNQGFEIFLQVGPHPIHSAAIKECLGNRGGSPLILASLRRGDSGLESMRWTSAFLYARGFDLEWSRVSPPGRFVRLPSYPWQREPFWLDDAENSTHPNERSMLHGNDRPSSHAPHQNGQSSGADAPVPEGHPALIEHRHFPEVPTAGIPNEDIAAHAVDCQIGQLSSLEPELRRQRLVEYFGQRVAAVLGMAPDRVDTDRPLLSLGLDSLSAMDLKVEIDAALGTTLPLSMLMDGYGIRELAEWASELLAVSPTGSFETPTAGEECESEPRLSDGQQLLWYAHQFSPTSAAYHITGAAIVRAKLDKNALRRACRLVLTQQDALRTTFTVVDERPAIRILDAGEFVLRDDEWLPFEDIADRNDAELDRKLAELAGRPFDLENGPLFRIHILSRSATEHVILLVVHHIIADFWSTSVLVDDIGKAYAAESAGRGTELLAPRLRYADFVRRQHEMLAGEEGRRHWAYWQQQLSGPLPVLDLPTDFTRPSIQSYRGAVKHFDLDPALTHAIVALGESRGISLYTTLLAAFQAFLCRYSGQNDILVGSPVAGRTRPGLDGLIGYFVNLLPMRGDLSGNPPFDEYLGRVRRTVAEGLEHQEFPFGLIINRLQGSPDPSRPPIFQVMFAHQKAQRLGDQGLAPFALGIGGAKLKLHGLVAESIAFDKHTTLFDLTLMTAMDGDRISVALEYSTDLFKSSTIDRIAEGFRRLLAAIVADPGRRLADLDVLSSSERNQLIGVWAGAPAIPSRDIAIHHCFERQAELSPDVIALVCGEQSFTYREVNRLSNLLAHRLLERGVRPAAVVGLYLERWPSKIIGALGVLKAGGAYLPLDTDYPAERLAAMLGDSGATVLVTEDNQRGQLPECPSLVVHLDPLADSLVGEEPENPRVCVDGENLAYVVFTSGSTGRPKGVMVSHTGLLAAAAAWEHAYDLRRTPTRHLQAAGFGFDVFTGDWVRALTTGGTLVACPRNVLLDPAALADLIRRERIDCLEVVPAVADALATYLERQGQTVGGVRLLAVGSDTVRRRLYRRLWKLIGPAGRVVNSYGLTEATIDSTCFCEPPEDREVEEGPVPIGRPMPGSRTYVLDERSMPAPVGVVGELCIAGPQVARGYVSNPRQTAERFLPDPYGEPGSRMYATGDRARWRDSGVLELLGRRDGQVKVRGFRVELGEVEAVLAQHPGVKESVVVVLKHTLGEQRLVAYVVPRTLSYPTTSDLRRWLKDRMPDPMVPSSYVFLEALPLSRNGKLDRSALPPPATLAGDSMATEFVPPRTAAEEILAGIATDLLGRSQVGVHDNFFEIGVDSILGIQMVSRARQAGMALGPADLFRYPNIADLATAAGSNLDYQAPSMKAPPAGAPFDLVPEGIDVEALKLAFADQGGIEDLYPLTPMQEGMLFHALADPEAGHYVEQFVCRIRGDLDQATLQETWNRLVARHPALRTTIHWIDFARPYQVVHRRADFPVEYHDWRGLTSSLQDEGVNAYLRSDRRRGFVPSRAPLSRLTLLRLGDTAHALIWSIHHVVIDGWCLSVLLHEFLDIDESIRRGNEPAMTSTRPFRDYVAWLFDQDDAQAEGYWRQALRGIRSPTPLGLEAPQSGERGASMPSVAERETVLSADVTAKLQQLGRSHRLTLSTVIQGAWALLLSRYSGRSDVLFGVTVSGRPPELMGVESMVGMFINSLPLRIAVIEEAHLVPWLREVQATMLELRRFEAVPLSRIQSWTDLPSGTPLFESIVIVQNLPFMASLQERANRLGIESARYLERTHYPLAVTVMPDTELGIKIGFDSDRFDPSAIERALGHLANVLEAMTVDPERRLADLPLLTESERVQLMGRGNGPQGEPSLADMHVEQLPESALDALLDQLRGEVRNIR